MSSMPLAHLHFRSEILGKQVAATVILPTQSPPWSTYYLLHGLSDDHTIWQRRTRIEVYAEQLNLPLMIVMPDGFRGFYTRNDRGPDYAKYIGEEVVGFIERTFNVKHTRGARAIGGLSMGGYGALRIGLGFPDRFCSLNSHSGAVMRGSRKDLKQPSGIPPHEDLAVFGPSPAGTDHDVIALARKCKRAGKLPKMLIDCGTEDFLLNENRSLHDIFRKEKIAHEYAEHPGAHNWDYWDEHVRTALRFHARNLKLLDE